MKLELIAAFAVMTLAGCAFQDNQFEQALAQPQPINYATAQGDIHVLESERAHVAWQVAAGATAIVPAGMVVGIVQALNRQS